MKYVPADTHTTLSLSVNNTWVTVEVTPRETLADVLRDHLYLVGTHLGCEHGVCGACTVLVDGMSARSCIAPALQFEGASIHTVEGIGGADGRLHPLQESFRAHHALQCGFCTPGFLVASIELLRTATDLTEPQVREALSGNLCRCTGYQGIVDAVLWADTHRGNDPSEPLASTAIQGRPPHEPEPLT